MSRIKIFDTTLRDGEQSPGVRLDQTQKLTIARQLVSLGVDIIEAGFPVASQGDFHSVREISRAAQEESGRVTVAALARANPGDVDRAAQALEAGARPRIHTFIATSPVHMEKKLNMTPDEGVERAVGAVRGGRGDGGEVGVSAGGAGRFGADFSV